MAVDNLPEEESAEGTSALGQPSTNNEIVRAQALHLEPIVSERAGIFERPALGDHALEPSLFDQLEEFPTGSDHVVGIANRLASADERLQDRFAFV